MRCGFTLLWICAGVARSFLDSRKRYAPAERAESLARLGGSSAVAGGELVYAVGGGWMRDSAVC